jgi:hypothetical protein
MSRKHPYVGQPSNQFWKRAPAGANGELVDPITDVPFQITPTDKIVTAGSCFAQHVARYLTESGFNHYVTEQAHQLLSEKLSKEHNYGVFSARYGNIYTARQLLQLVTRAYDDFEPIVQIWPSLDKKTVVDPFRPQIQPNGFLNKEELAADVKQHLAAVRKSFEEMDLFVFTLGLTEAWRDKRDGAVYPIAPGIFGGVFDEQTTEFYNFDHNEIEADLRQALELIRSRNPTVKFIVTVSPVPLNATYIPRHVWVSTTWSKAALRIAAESVTHSVDNCCYFPSYEIITSPHVRGRYYAEDGREVLEAGVNHVMGLLSQHFFEGWPTREKAALASKEESYMERMENVIEVLCDEASIDNE